MRISDWSSDVCSSDLTGNVDKIRRAIFEALAPDDLVERHRWLFAEQWVSESGDDIWDDDFDYNKHAAHIDALRRSAIAEIRVGLGFDGDGRLLSSVHAWYPVAHYLCKLMPVGDRVDVVAQIRAPSGTWWGREGVGW